MPRLSVDKRYALVTFGYKQNCNVWCSVYSCIISIVLLEEFWHSISGCSREIPFFVPTCVNISNPLGIGSHTVNAGKISGQ